jgi:hypothetical protein
MLVQDAANDKVTICTVQVVPSRQIVLSGKSSLPNGTCLHTQLFTGRKPEAWWPTFACASVQDGAWQMLVPLSCGGAPDELDQTLQYTLCAWMRGDPTTQSVLEVDWIEASTPDH